MIMRKKILSVLLAVCIVWLSLSVSITAFATTRTIELNVKTTNHIDGAGDLLRYIFTPEKSGTYSFLSYNSYASEAYLFIRERNPDTGEKVYKQLAFSNNDPDYKANGHVQRQFCLTYHLDAGTTYYFDAGWALDTTYTERGETEFTVMLRCDEYDEKVVKSIELSCPAVLDAYTDGQWLVDPSGTYSYYYYNISKIMVNMTITVNYSDGNTSVVYGNAETVDGYDIVYKHTQAYNHWYPQSTDDYTANTLTVQIADGSADFDVPIKISAMYGIMGTVTDYAGNPVENVKICESGTTTVAETDSNGYFSCSMISGLHKLTLSGSNIISRDISIIVSAATHINDYTGEPIELVTCDYVGDGVINAKDYSYIIKNLTDEELDRQKAQFGNAINFTKADYKTLVLTAEE